MPVYQTSQQRDNSLLIGGAKVEVSSDGSTWYDVGLVRDLSLTETITQSDIQAQNGIVTEKFVTEQYLDGTMNMLEVNLTNYNRIRGGVDTLTTVAGTPVSGATYALTAGNWGYNDPIIVENQNYDLSALTINSVTGSEDGALVEDTDFFVGTDAKGNTIITIIDSATVTTETQTMTIDYDYTPAASEKLSTGGKSSISAVYYRFTNLKYVNSVAKYRIITIYSASVSGGLSLAFANDADADPATVIPVSFRAEMDTSRTAGDQLYLFENQIV